MNYTVLWSFLSLLAIGLAASFGYMFYKDKDKRKLMFALAFVFASPGHMLMDVGWENVNTYEGVLWGVIPITAAFLIVSVSSILNVKSFDKPFKAFLVVLGTSIVLMFTPLPVKTILPPVMQAITIIVIIASVYVYLKKREISNLMLLLSMVFFGSAGFGIGIGLEAYFNTFSYAFAYVFIGLVFVTSKESGNGDISQYFTLKKELENTKEELKNSKDSQEQRVKSERLAAIGQAATMVGHDLRNPLQAIENATYYLNTELAKNPVSEEAEEAMQAINRSIAYADSIVNDLLCFASTRKPVFMKTDINDLIKETIIQINVPANQKTVLELSDKLPKIEGDKEMLKRVFINILANGMQAMENNGGNLAVATKQKNGTIEVLFRDTGVGIPQENMQQIFMPFFTTKAQGMGVGLAICKRFVEQHNGTIEVQSTEGEGSIFTIKLPIKRIGGEKA